MWVNILRNANWEFLKSINLLLNTISSEASFLCLEAIGTLKNLSICSCQWRINPQIILVPFFSIVEKSVLEESFLKSPQGFWGAVSCKTFVQWVLYRTFHTTARLLGNWVGGFISVGLARKDSVRVLQVPPADGAGKDWTRRSPLQARVEDAGRQFVCQETSSTRVQDTGEGPHAQRVPYTCPRTTWGYSRNTVNCWLSCSLICSPHLSTHCPFNSYFVLDSWVTLSFFGSRRRGKQQKKLRLPTLRGLRTCYILPAS